MDLKPLNDTQTLKLQINPVQISSLQAPTRSSVDKEGLIPNGIYKVIRWEIFRQRFTFVFAGLLLIAMVILIALYATVFQAGGASYVIPAIVVLLSGWKLLNTFMEYRWLKKSLRIYKEDLRINLGSDTPVFITKIYNRLHTKQVAHNWLTFTILFYGGIATILLWLLKDASWWIFEFQKWIHQLFANPELMSWLFTAALILVLIVHVVFLIQRKARIMDINAYFGQHITTDAEIATIRQDRNKFYRRLFILSIMIVFIIPIVVYIIIRLVRFKK